MAITAVIHIVGEDAFVADLDALPEPGTSYLVLHNLRKKDNKPLPYLTDGAGAVLYSWNRVTFIELMGDVAGTTPVAAANRQMATTVLGFFREDDN